MKRISASSLSTALQIPSQTISFADKSSDPSENNNLSKKTALPNQTITEKPAHFRFPHSLFAECFPSAFETLQQNKAYRKLQYHSLDKREIVKLQKNSQERKTMSLQNSILSFGKQKLSNEIGPITKIRPINQCVIADTVGAHDNSKCNVYNGIKNTGRSSFMVSTRNTVNERLQKYQSSLNSKFFLSQDVKIPNILSPVQPINNVQSDKTKSQTKNCSDQNETIVKKRRLSTNDSIKLKENAQTEQSQGTNSPLQIASILCESTPVNQQNIHQQNAFQFDHMKDSLIDKLNLFRKQESFIESKRKSFIRSNKKMLQESPRFCNFKPNFLDKTQKNHENEQEFSDFEQIDSKQTVQEKLIRNKFKTLKECAKTIVSKYNKSSEQKSILQESNIVFQASKMCADPYDQNLKFPTFSDSQVVFDNEVKENFDNDKQYNSFIHEVDSRENHGLQMSNPNGNSMSKKVNRAFLRSKKSSSQKQIRYKENDEMEIRFDLDTFIEYGPL